MNRLNKVFGVLNDIHDGLITVVFIAAIIISGYGVYDVWYIYDHADDRQYMDYSPDSPVSELEKLPVTDDMVGWIYFSDVGINFPVMQGENNLTYLNKDPAGNFSLSGSIFLDSRNSPGFTDEYSMIYGHHMAYGRMFGALDKFLDRDFAFRHRNGTLLIGRNGEQRRKLTVFAVVRADADALAAFDVENPSNARDYLLSEAGIRFGVPGDHILALSTCDGENDSMRIIVACSIE